MSFFDYVLPWKAVPNMVRDVKSASSLEGKHKYDSVFGAVGKYADPAGALLGDDWMKFWHERIPRQANKWMQGWNEFHMNYLDPLAIAGVTPDVMRDAASYKGADVTAGALGGTALGMMGAGALGGAGGTSTGATSGGAAGGGSMWSNPNTYMGLMQTPSQPQQVQQVPVRRAPTDGLLAQLPLVPPQPLRRTKSYLNWFRHV